MATLIWVFMWCGFAMIGAVILMAAVQYFIYGDSKEEVIASMKELLKGEELD